MKYSRFILLILSVIATTFLASPLVQGQTYPSKPVRLIAPYPPGGGVDAAARIVANSLSEALGQQVIVENRGGASGRIGTEITAQAPADGYTLLLGSVGPNAIIPAAYKKLPYDAVKDFEPVSQVADADYILTVHPSLPVKSVKDLITLARARPGQIAFASTGNLGGPHLAGELFKQLAKVNMVHVPYKGGGPAIISILSGETSLIFGSGPTVVPHAKAGKLRLIATTGSARSKILPELPTVGETLPGCVVTQWYGILTPTGVSPAIISRLNGEIVKAFKNPTVVEQLNRLGASAHTTSPEQFAALIKVEIAKWGKVIKSAGIKVE